MTLTQLIEVTGVDSHNEQQELTGILEFRDSLHALCLAHDRYDPTSVLCSIKGILGKMKETMAVVRANPGKLPAPVPCQLPGEVTVRARLGLGVAAEYLSKGIVEKLTPLELECDELWKAANQLQVNCEKILRSLKLCSEGVTQKCIALAALDKTVEAAFLRWASCLDEQISIQEHVSKAGVNECLDVVGVQKNIILLAGIPGEIRRLQSKACQQVEKIQEFSRRAPEEVRRMFVLPFPANTLQSVLVGNDPPTKTQLLAKLNSLGILDVCQISVRLRNLVDKLEGLQMQLAEESFLKFAAQSSECVKALEQRMQVLGKDDVLKLLQQIKRNRTPCDEMNTGGRPDPCVAWEASQSFEFSIPSLPSIGLVRQAKYLGSKDEQKSFPLCASLGK